MANRGHPSQGRRFRDLIRATPIVGPIALNFHRGAKRFIRMLLSLRSSRQVGQLFGDHGVRTAAGGLSHARFVQFTELTHELHLRILDILEKQRLDYVLFAGHLVGHQRDGQIPLWSEDVDIAIFPDAFELFESRCIPALEQAGFEVLATTDWQPSQPFGGYAILGISRTQSHVELSLGSSEQIRAPRAQVDVFFSKVDARGFVRNVGGWWGRYHSADIPVGAVLPTRDIELHGRTFPSYRDPATAVRIEYGNVKRWVHVYSHFFEHPHLLFFTPSWEAFRERLDIAIARTTSSTLPGGPSAPVSVSTAAGTYSAEEGSPLSELLEDLQTGHYGTVILPGTLILWVLDLKRWFPGLRVLYRPLSGSDEDRRLGLQLAHLIDGTVETDS